VELADGDARSFDCLVLAPGVVPWNGTVPSAAEHAEPLKTVTDAARIRNSIQRSFDPAAAPRRRRARASSPTPRQHL
jgi:NADH dehydrogenase FAD-containing subunit